MIHQTTAESDKENEVERWVRDPQSALKVQDSKSNVLLSMIHFITNEAEPNCLRCRNQTHSDTGMPEVMGSSG